jgi:hypothetical protein
MVVICARNVRRFIAVGEIACSSKDALEMGED